MLKLNEYDISQIIGILEYNDRKLKKPLVRFSKDGTRYHTKPISPEKHEEWLNIFTRIEKNQLVIDKLSDNQDISSDDIELIIDLLEVSIHNNEIYLLQFNLYGTKCNGKMSSDAQIRQRERRMNSIIANKGILEKLT